MKKPARKTARKPAKKPAAKKSALRKFAARKSESAFNEDGVQLRRLETQIFHAEDREEGDEDTGEDVSERSVSLSLETDGQLVMSAFERDLSSRMHGDRDEEEFRSSVTIQPAAMGRLAYALASERFKGEWGADRDFRTFCLAHDIPFEDDES